MTPEEAKAAVALVDEWADAHGSRPLLECSGGITVETAAAYAATGVDLLVDEPDHPDPLPPSTSASTSPTGSLRRRAAARARRREHPDGGGSVRPRPDRVREPRATAGGLGLIDHWRIATNAERTADEHALVLQEFLGLPRLDLGRQRHPGRSRCARRSRGSRVRCGACPSATSASPPSWWSRASAPGCPILYDNPKEVGADRIADAVGAFDLFGGPTIVIDFGTATTFEAISAKGEYLGGRDLPGHRHQPRRALRPRRRAAAGGAGRAPLGDRPQHGGVDPVRA